MADKFEQDTAITVSGKASVAAISADWSLRKPVSGYLASIALRAAADAGQKRRPASASFDFAAVPTTGPADLSTEVLCSSPKTHCISVSMRQSGKLILTATIWSVGTLAASLEHDFEHAPSVAHADHYPSLAELAKKDEFGDVLPVFRSLEERPVDWNSPRKWRQRNPEQTAWFRYPGASDHADPYLAAARSLVPISMMPAFAAMMPHSVWHANMDQFATTTRLAVNFHNALPSDWLLVRGEAPVAGGGIISGTAKAWNEDGKLLATGITQLVGA
jgi:acyl-CoA thioesterase